MKPLLTREGLADLANAFDLLVTALPLEASAVRAEVRIVAAGIRFGLMGYQDLGAVLDAAQAAGLSRLCLGVCPGSVAGHPAAGAERGSTAPTPPGAAAVPPPAPQGGPGVPSSSHGCSCGHDVAILRKRVNALEQSMGGVRP